MEYIAKVSAGSTEKAAHIKTMLLESNPLLEGLIVSLLRSNY